MDSYVALVDIIPRTFLSTPCNGFRRFSKWLGVDLVVLEPLSTPCNGFLELARLPVAPRFPLPFQLHVMDSFPPFSLRGVMEVFQLHVMDSLGAPGRRKYSSRLSTPCNGFCTMGALVLVYCFVIVGFYYVFYCCTSVFSALGPP